MKIFNKMIYLDNAATTHKKPRRVKRAVNLAMTKYCANAGRGGHTLSIKASEQVFKTRQILNNLFNGYGESNVIFVENCTEALNLAILGLLKSGDHVIATKHEHNSVLRPLIFVKNNRNVQVDIISPANLHNVRATDFKPHIKPNTKMIIVSHISNVLGSVASLKEIGALCRAHNIAFLVDAAQSAGHVKIDMQRSNIDLLALASHKGLFGIGGASALLKSDRVKLLPIKFGGTGTNSQILMQNFEAPEVYESGTKSLPAIMALGAGAEFAQKRAAKIENKTKNLCAYIIANAPKTVTMHTKNAVGVVTFNIGSVHSTDVAAYLNKKNIAVRAGFHCAPLAHELMGTSKQGAVRASISYFTKKHDCKKLIAALKKFV